MDQQILILRLVHPKRRAPLAAAQVRVVQPLHLAVQAVQAQLLLTKVKRAQKLVIHRLIVMIRPMLRMDQNH